MNEYNRSGYINTPAQGKQLQQQRAAAQSQYLQGGYTPQGGQAAPQTTIPQAGYNQQQAYQQQARQTAPQGNPVYPGQQGYVPRQPQYQQQPQSGYQQPQYQQQPYPAQQPQAGYQRVFQDEEVPQKPQRQKKPRQPRKPFNPDILLKGVLFVVLPVLLVLCLIPGASGTLKWIFVAAAVAMGALMWVKPFLSQGNTRLTVTVVLLVTAVVVAISALTAESTDTVNNGNGVAPPSSESNVVTATVINPFGEDESESSVEIMTAVPAATATPEPSDSLSSECVAQLQSFFYFWSVNKHDEMVGLCAPSWKSSVSEPNTELFSILANRTPVDWIIEKVSGTDNDINRTVTLTATIDKNKGTDPSKYRMSIIMLKENETWYVDPRSLRSAEAESETPTPEPEDTPTPTPEQIVTSSTILYYNPDGGSLYHADPNCKKVGQKYTPLKGTFTYAEVNDEPYASLDACNVCNAPLRGF